MKWNFEKRKIKDLFDHAKNPRRLSKDQSEQLKKSLEKFGQCEPIVINSDNTIIGGHQRVRTMRKLGRKEVDVYVSDSLLSEKEVEELNIRLNKNTGDWDWDILGNLWDPEDLLSYGFTESELEIDKETIEEIKSVTEPENEGNSPSKCTMVIKFKHPEHLQEAENRIRLIADEYEGSSCKVKL